MKHTTYLLMHAVSIMKITGITIWPNFPDHISTSLTPSTLMDMMWHQNMIDCLPGGISSMTGGLELPGLPRRRCLPSA
jgi:hypothetical protein